MVELACADDIYLGGNTGQVALAPGAPLGWGTAVCLDLRVPQRPRVRVSQLVVCVAAASFARRVNVSVTDVCHMNGGGG